MTPNLYFWLYAYVVMLAILISGGIGIQKARAGLLHQHRKLMNIANTLILVFVGSYVVKMLVLKREAKTGWSTTDFITLYTHEFFIAVMLVAGGYAFALSRKLKDSLDETAPSAEIQTLRQKHGRFGKIAYVSALLAFITATLVLRILFSHA